MSAWENYFNRPHTPAEIYRDLGTIWNAKGFTPKDLRDWQRMSTLLETELSKRIPQERNRIEPGRMTRRRRWK